MDYTILIGVTAVSAAIVALAAWIIARQIARAKGDIGMWPILLAIVISLVVLQGAAKLAVISGALMARQGIDLTTAIGGQLHTAAFAASFVPIAAYVLTFLFTFKKAKAGQ